MTDEEYTAKHPITEGEQAHINKIFHTCREGGFAVYVYLKARRQFLEGLPALLDKIFSEAPT